MASSRIAIEQVLILVIEFNLDQKIANSHKIRTVAICIRIKIIKVREYV